ncbi:MAG: hypothetical protein KKA12_06260 [Alphaproteobacteria bacterium]|nr:hypothetical protein [Alphaproteobacteria bacterium]
MTLYILTMLAGFAVLIFWPVSRDKLIRNASKSLAVVVFSVGLVGLMSQLLVPVV